ncbi:hypothetical protein C8R46DRAFT_1218370 [Mycena filopes]|nr:hypothetical protein C8R46DRAFT_1218370 [Mycena filopes]
MLLACTTPPRPCAVLRTSLVDEGEAQVSVRTAAPRGLGLRVPGHRAVIEPYWGLYIFVVFAARSTPFILLEKTHFPQYHIGESMLPSCRPFIRSIDVEQKVVDHGFCVKVGAALKFNQTKREGYTDFINRDPNTAAWNVGRTEFDEILFKNARVVEGVSVGSINFSGENDKQPISAEWTATAKIVRAHAVRTTGLTSRRVYSGIFGHFVDGEQNNLKMGVIDGASPSPLSISPCLT